MSRGLAQSNTNTQFELKMSLKLNLKPKFNKKMSFRGRFALKTHNFIKIRLKNEPQRIIPVLLLVTRLTELWL